MLKRKLTAFVSDIVIHEGPPRVVPPSVPTPSPPQDAEWRNAVLRRLQRRYGGGGQGTLYCNPAVQREVSNWLCQHPHLAWDVRADTTLTDTHVRLVTAQGETLMHWRNEAFQR